MLPLIWWRGSRWVKMAPLGLALLMLVLLDQEAEADASLGQRREGVRGCHELPPNFGNRHAGGLWLLRRRGASLVPTLRLIVNTYQLQVAKLGNSRQTHP
jgi:hypothetical protein